MVVDFAVANDMHVVGFVGHRLMAACSVDDGEAGMEEGGVIVSEEAVGVGTAVSDRLRHREERCECGGARAPRWRAGRGMFDDAGDATHERTPGE